MRYFCEPAWWEGFVILTWRMLRPFGRSNQAVRGIIRPAAVHNVNRIRFKNPFIPGIRFTVGTGLQIICSHERRHLLQARRVKQSLLESS